MPDDGICVDCGSDHLEPADNTDEFAAQMAEYFAKREQLVGFYKKCGTLIDFELKQGYDSYDVLKREIQHNIKH